MQHTKCSILTCCIFSKSRHGRCRLCGLGVLDRCRLFGDGVDMRRMSEFVPAPHSVDDDSADADEADEDDAAGLNCSRISSSSAAAATVIATSEADPDDEGTVKPFDREAEPQETYFRSPSYYRVIVDIVYLLLWE